MRFFGRSVALCFMPFMLFACGESSDADLFSGAGRGASSAGGAAGAQTSGSSPSGGSAAETAAPPIGGTAGAGSSGGSTAAGSHSDAGAPTSGSPSTAGGGSGGSTALGGSGGAAGSAGSAGSAGTSNAGSGGTPGVAGNAGSAGTGGSTGIGGTSSGGCAEAQEQTAALLREAQRCNNGVNREQCVGFVTNECGCEVAVNDPDSDAAEAYAAHVEKLRGCSVVCPAVICRLPNRAVCRSNGSSSAGQCVAQFGLNQSLR